MRLMCVPVSDLNGTHSLQPTAPDAEQHKVDKVAISFYMLFCTVLNPFLCFPVTEVIPF